MRTTFFHTCVSIALACAASGCGNSRNVERTLVITDEMLAEMGASPETDPLLKDMEREARPARKKPDAPKAP